MNNRKISQKQSVTQAKSNADKIVNSTQDKLIFFLC